MKIKNYKNFLATISSVIIISCSYVTNIFGMDDIFTEDKKYTFDLTINNKMSSWSFIDINMSILEAYRVADDKFFQASDNLFINGIGYITRLLITSANSVFAHEVAGHGGRLREVGAKDIDYKIGFFEGSTRFININNKTKWSQDYNLAIAVAGMETSHLLGEEIKNRYLEQGVINPVYGISYFINKSDQPLYIFYTSNKTNLKNNKTNYDPVSYIKQINKLYGYNHLSPNKLKQYAILDLLDPFLYSSIYSFFSNSELNLPMISINEKVRYAPSMRSILTPYGVEACLSNHFLIEGDKYIRLNLAYGKKQGPQSKSYMASIKTNQVIKAGNISFGMEGAYWKQPELLTKIRKSKKGLLWMVNGELELTPNLSLIASLGYKTKGFYIGLPLKKSTLFKGGLRFNYNI